MVGWRKLSITLWAGLSLVGGACGHASMDEPPQRSARWRFDNVSLPNYNDDQLNCGGFGLQYSYNGGKCGVCGDPWNEARHNEAGGKYANGEVVRTYRRGDVINVKVRMTTGHSGYFQFRLCPHNDPRHPVRQECLNQHLLRIREGPASGGTPTRFRPGYGRLKNFQLHVQLPPTVTCWQCVLQFWYKAGNNWGCDAVDGCCEGCGDQENFVNCADVAIFDSPSPPAPASSTAVTSPPTARTAVTSSATAPAPVTSGPRRTSPPTSQPGWGGGRDSSCRVVGALSFVPGMTVWCQLNCPSNCPAFLCTCTPR